jgi:phosphate starvation-inducible PhoH-like protein
MARKRPSEQSETIEIKHSLGNRIKLKPKKFKFTQKQQQLLEILLSPESHIVFISGPAGSSKTYLAVYAALSLLLQNEDSELIYVRSIIESAEKGLGSLPGTLDEKFDPFLMPLYDKLDEIISPQDSLFLKKDERIKALPVNFLRGANWANKIVVSDEAQNFTRKELTTLITRLGEGSKLFICGDYNQSDINGKSGFKCLKEKFSDKESESWGIYGFSFTKDDIVRSDKLKFIVGRLEEEN